MVTRRAFIEATGATCRNWRWSWAFVNHSAREVISGAWDIAQEGGSAVILDEAWARNVVSGRAQPAYPEAKAYLTLVELEGYRLRTFPMGHALIDPSEPRGTARIAHFVPELSEAVLLRDGRRWLACTVEGEVLLPDEAAGSTMLTEGGRKSVLVNAVERNARARAECLRLHGLRCKVCDLDFFQAYGEVGQGFIHVHHLMPIAAATDLRTVDPMQDLVPVCPNCHAMLHRRSPPFEIEELRHMMQSSRSAP